MHLFLPTEGKDKYQTCPGLSLTILLVLLLSGFVVHEVAEFIYSDGADFDEVSDSKRDIVVYRDIEEENLTTSFFEHTQLAAISSEEVFPQSNDDVKFMSLAFGLVSKDDADFTSVPLEYGSIRTFYRRGSDGTGEASEQELMTHACTEAELESGDDNESTLSLFYPALYKDTASTIAKYADKLKCFDAPVSLYGDSETNNHQ